MNRKQEKKMKENLLMLEDERRHADQYKEQAEKVFVAFIKANFNLLLGTEYPVYSVAPFIRYSRVRKKCCIWFINIATRRTYEFEIITLP